MQQKTFFRGPMLITLDPPAVEAADLLVVDGRIARKGWRLDAPRDAEVIDARGRILCPGLVDAHVRLDAAFARTMPIAAGGAADLQRILAEGTEESWIAAAFATGIEAARAGTTTICAFHDATGFVRGSLGRVRDVMSTIGIRSSSACAMSGALAETALEAALAESRDAGAFASGGRTAVLLGAGDLADATEPTLAALAEAGRRHEVPIHAIVGSRGDAPWDIRRLREAGLLRKNSILVAAGPIPKADADELRAAQVSIVQAPWAGLTGPATTAPLGASALGTDGGRPDLFESARLAFARARAAGDAIEPQDVVSMLARGQAIASAVLKEKLGAFDAGAAADIIVLDYRPPTPLNASTLGHHVLFGIGASHVQSVMVDGHFVVRDRMITSVDVRNLFRQTQRGALDLWLRAVGSEYPGINLPMRPASAVESGRREPEPVRDGDVEIDELPRESLKPWLVCRPGAEPETVSAAPPQPTIPPPARRDTTPSRKDPPGGFGAGIL